MKLELLKREELRKLDKPFHERPEADVLIDEIHLAEPYKCSWYDGKNIYELYFCRVNDPFLSEKLLAETDAIFLWAYKGLRRLIANSLLLQKFRILLYKHSKMCYNTY